MKSVIVAIGLFFQITLLYAQESAYELCLETFRVSKSIKTMTFTMEKQERIKSKIIKQISDTKLQNTPFYVYSKQVFPNAGLEVLYKESTNNGKILVNPNGFPWMNLNLDPMGSTARKDQHHTIKDSGFDLVINILEFLFQKYGDDVLPMLTSEKLTIDGVHCKKIVFTNPNFKYVYYTVKENENLVTIAKERMLSEYMILEKNKNISSYDAVKKGDKIIIPNDYSPKMELIIELERKIPVSIKVFDDKGLYEYYKYSNVVLNPKFTSNEFDSNNSSYGF